MDRKLNDTPVTVSRVSTVAHVAKEAEMAKLEKVSQSEIMRRAIDALYDKLSKQHQKPQ